MIFLGILNTVRHSAIWARWICDSSFFLLLSVHLSLSNGLFANELRRVFYLLSNSLVQGTKELSWPRYGLWVLCTCSSSGRKQMPQEQKINPPGTCFMQDWHWTVLVFCPSSCNPILPSSWIERLDSSLKFEPGFPKSWMIDLVCRPVRNLSTTFWICSILSSFFKITSCAIPSNLRSTSNSGSCFSTSHSALRICFQMLGGSGLSVGVPWSSFRTSFLVLPETQLPDVSCCCCGCQALLSTIFVASRGVESLLPFLRNHFVDTICGHRAADNYGMRPCLPES